MGASEGEAAERTCVEWKYRPRSEAVEIAERLGRHQRDAGSTVTLGGFHARSLREWAALYREHRDNPLPHLAPRRKTHAGRKALDIPQPFLDLIAAYSTSTARSDVVRGYARACELWPGTIPEAHIATIRRRINKLDPAKLGASLGQRGVAHFRANHSPDVETDYLALAYNDEWQLDDVTEDFYGHSCFDPARLVRPFAYAIIRVATRQWICVVTSETKIVQDQVRALVGVAMAARSGGIPKRIKFERGTIALDDYLQGQLDLLGVGWGRTSMDGGASYPGAIPDRASGHFQGKGVVESNIRLHHDHAWDTLAGTGPDERTTAHANLETLKAEAIRRAKAGEQLILPTADQWPQLVLRSLERHNNAPHGSLPERLDPETMQRVRLTPNEYGAVLLAREPAPVRTLDERCLPAFYQRGLQIPVTRNGITLNGHSYGRFDADLAAFAGQSVMAYSHPDVPAVAYVVELGRCIERYTKSAPGAGEQIGQKRGIEAAKRNQHEALMARAIEAEKSITLETVAFTANPATEGRPISLLAPQAMLDRSHELRTGAQKHREVERQRAERFSAPSGDTPPSTPPPQRRRRGSLLDAARTVPGESFTEEVHA